MGAHGAMRRSWTLAFALIFLVAGAMTSGACGSSLGTAAQGDSGNTIASSQLTAYIDDARPGISAIVSGHIASADALRYMKNRKMTAAARDMRLCADDESRAAGLLDAVKAPSQIVSQLSHQRLVVATRRDAGNFGRFAALLEGFSSGQLTGGQAEAKLNKLLPDITKSRKEFWRALEAWALPLAELVSAEGPDNRALLKIQNLIAKMPRT